MGSEILLFLAQLLFWVAEKRYPGIRGILLLAGDIVQSMLIMNMKPVYSYVKNISVATFKVNEQTYTSPSLL